mgnify:CR=1 FL=1
MALPILGSALGLVGDLAGNWLKGKVEKQKAEGEVKVAEAKAKAVILEKQATGESALRGVGSGAALPPPQPLLIRKNIL